jgi:hypothetical protein
MLNLKFVVFLEILEKAGFTDHYGNQSRDPVEFRFFAVI